MRINVVLLAVVILSLAFAIDGAKVKAKANVKEKEKKATDLTDDQLANIFVDTVDKLGRETLEQDRKKAGPVNTTAYIRKWKQIGHLMIDVLQDTIYLEEHYNDYPSMVRVGISRSVTKKILNSSSDLIGTTVWALQLSSMWNLIQGLDREKLLDILPQQLTTILQNNANLKSEAEQFTWTHDVMPEIANHLARKEQLKTAPEPKPQPAPKKKPSPAPKSKKPKRSKEEQERDELIRLLDEKLGPGLDT